MIKPPAFSAEYLKSRLDYNPETGIFIWKAIPVLHHNNGIWNACHAGNVAGRINKGYVEISILQKRYLAHRLAWMIVHGEYPTMPLDHINRRPNDNRISNLRQVTMSQNSMNHAQKIGKSGHRGVQWFSRDKRWVANIQVNGKNIYLGGSKNIEDAILLRKQGEEKYFGEYRNTNWG